MKPREDWDTTEAHGPQVEELHGHEAAGFNPPGLTREGHLYVVFEDIQAPGIREMRSQARKVAESLAHGAGPDCLSVHFHLAYEVVAETVETTTLDGEVAHYTLRLTTKVRFLVAVKK